MEYVLQWWERSLRFALGLSIALLGVGNIGFFHAGAGVSAWSVSRTAFFFWLIWKFLLWLRYGYAHFEWGRFSPAVPVLLFFALVTVSLLPSFRNAGDYRYFLLGTMHYLMILDLFANSQRARLLFLLLALLPGVLLVRGIWHDPAVLDLTSMQRIAYPLPHPNIAGYLFAMTIPLCMALAMVEKGKLRWLALGSFAAQLTALVLTYSRGSWLGWLVSMLFFGATLKLKEVGVLLLAGGLLISVATPLRDRVFTLIRPQTDLSINERLQAMEAGLRLGLAHPILGVGYGRGRLREGLLELSGDGPGESYHIAHTHNLYIELFAETGALGLVAFLWLIGHAFYQTLANARQQEGTGKIYQFGMAASLIAFAVTGFGDVPFFHHSVRILFFTILALTHIGGRQASATQSHAGRVG